jgi:hypothetical protein
MCTYVLHKRMEETQIINEKRLPHENMRDKLNKNTEKNLKRKVINISNENITLYGLIPLHQTKTTPAVHKSDNTKTKQCIFR